MFVSYKGLVVLFWVILLRVTEEMHNLDVKCPVTMSWTVRVVFVSVEFFVLFGSFHKVICNLEAGKWICSEHHFYPVKRTKMWWLLCVNSSVTGQSFSFVWWAPNSQLIWQDAQKINEFGDKNRSRNSWYWKSTSQFCWRHSEENFA